MMNKKKNKFIIKQPSTTSTISHLSSHLPSHHLISYKTPIERSLKYDEMWKMISSRGLEVNNQLWDEIWWEMVDELKLSQKIKISHHLHISCVTISSTVSSSYISQSIISFTISFLIFSHAQLVPGINKISSSYLFCLKIWDCEMRL